VKKKLELSISIVGSHSLLTTDFVCVGVMKLY